MATASQYTADASDGMGHAQTFRRLRRGTATDPYDPENKVTLPWGQADDELPIQGALVSRNSQELTAAARAEATSEAQLVITDTQADIRRGDRVYTIPDDGRRWDVQGFPHADMNPFTGWRPTMVCELKEVQG